MMENLQWTLHISSNSTASSNQLPSSSKQCSTVFLNIYWEFWSLLHLKKKLMQLGIFYIHYQIYPNMFTLPFLLLEDKLCDPIHGIPLLLHWVHSHLIFPKTVRHNWSCMPHMFSVFLGQSNHPSFHPVRIHELYFLWYIETLIFSIRTLRLNAI